MVGPVPYLFLPGTARAALTFYRDVFGGSLTLHTYAEFGRDDGPADAIAHGVLSGAVDLYAADVSGEQRPLRAEGLSFALLGAAPPATLRGWFEHLAAGGTVIDPLAVRAWGATDGQLLDRYGIHWLIGHEGTG
jgi:PhnB protein